MNSTSSRLLFLHIPKAAGTAFVAYLSRHLGIENCSDRLNQIKWRDALARYSDCKLISGHLFATIGDQLPADRESIVILREPLDRFLSSFYFQNRDASDVPIAQRRATSNLDLDSYIDTLLDSERESLNVQTEMLYPLGTAEFPPHTWETKVAAAKTALDRFQLVGIQSDIEDFALMAANRLGWAIGGGIGYENVTSRRVATTDLTREQRQRLSGLLQPDLEVYAHARARFVRDRRSVLMLNGVHGPEIGPGTQVGSSAGRQSVVAVDPGARPEEVTEFGDRRVEILGVDVCGEISGPQDVLTGELVTITVQFVAHQPAEDFTVGFSIRGRRGGTLFGSNTKLQGASYDICAGQYCAIFKFFNRFGEGSYFVDIDLHKALSILDAPYHSKRSAALFNVVGRCGAYFEGSLLLDVDATILPDAAGTELLTKRPIDAIAPTLFVGRLTPPLREFSAQLRQLQKVSTLSTSDGLLVSVEITNTSACRWPTNGKRPVQLSYRWYTAKGEIIIADGLRTRLPEDLEPGASVVVRGLLRAPEVPGDMTLVWDMVQEHVRWFSDGNPECALSSAVQVR
jgi:Wzt C-terminal domain/Sulfotransferase family